MQLVGLARIGRDAEVRFTPAGKAVCNISLAFNYGLKQDGQQPTQWIDASLWGDRAEKLSPYLLKGQLIYVVLTDPHIETYTKRDGGDASKLVAMVNLLEFAGGSKQDGGQSKPAAQASVHQSAAGGKSPGQNIADMDDDIPF